MYVRTILAALAVIVAGFMAPASALAAPAKAKKGHIGWDNRGRKNVCRGAGAHPHWRAPAKKKTKKHAGGGRCDPNYSGACVPIASDVDCAGGSGNGPKYVNGPVHVVGSDIYDLDRDGDGIGCD